MKRSILPMLLLWVITAPGTLAWDGNWTDGKSMDGEAFNDPTSTQGQAGTPPPQKYFTAPPRDVVNVDPEELNDYFHHHNKDYAPYVLTRITQTLHYNNLVIPKGYYLLKPGDWNDGSPRTHLGTPAMAAPENPTPPAIPTANPGKHSMPTPAYQVFVIKKQGNVVAVVPIHRMSRYERPPREPQGANGVKPPPREKPPHHALAWIEAQNQHPVLKFYYKKYIYETDFQ